MTEKKFKTLKLSDISTGNDFIEFTAKEKYGKQIEVIDYIPLLDTSRNSDLLREKFELGLAERIPENTNPYDN